MYSFSSVQQIINLTDYKEDLVLFGGASREQLAYATELMEKYTQCGDLSLLTPNDAEGIFLVLYQLAQIHQIQGNADKALRYLRECEELCQKAGMKDSLHLAYSYFLHANLEKENWTEAEHYLNEVDRICRLLGEENKEAKSLMLQGLGALTTIYIKQDKHDKAFDIANLVLQKIEDLDAMESQSVLVNVYHTMASIYESREDVDNAIEFYAKSLGAATKYYGENSPEAYNISCMLTQFLSDHGPAHPNALQHIENKLKTALKVFPKDSAEVLGSYRMLGSFHLFHGNEIEALAPFEEIVKICEKSPQGKLITLEDAYLELVKIHLKQGDLKKASNLLAKADQLVATYVKDKETLAEKYLKRLKQLGQFKNMHQECEAYQYKALELYKNIDPRNNGKIQEIYGTLGFNTFRQKNYSKAYELFKESEKYIAGPEKDLFGFRILHTYLGSICMYLGKFDEAEKHILKVLEVSKGTDNLEDIGVNYHNLAILYERRGHQKEAMELKNKAEEIQQVLNKYSLGILPSELKYKTL